MEKSIESIDMQTANENGHNDETQGWVYRGSSRYASQEKNLNYLLYLMEKAMVDVNDREICRRLRIFLASFPYDITFEQKSELHRHGEILTEKGIHESILPFYRHFIFMTRKRPRQVAV